MPWITWRHSPDTTASWANAFQRTAHSRWNTAPPPPTQEVGVMILRRKKLKIPTEFWNAQKTSWILALMASLSETENSVERPGRMAHWVKLLPAQHEDLCSNPKHPHKKLGVAPLSTIFTFMVLVWNYAGWGMLVIQPVLNVYKQVVRFN